MAHVVGTSSLLPSFALGFCAAGGDTIFALCVVNAAEHITTARCGGCRLNDLTRMAPRRARSPSSLAAEPGADGVIARHERLVQVAALSDEHLSAAGECAAARAAARAVQAWVGQKVSPAAAYLHHVHEALQ